MSINSLVVRGSTKISLHERFTNLKKVAPQPPPPPEPSFPPPARLSPPPLPPPRPYSNYVRESPDDYHYRHPNHIPEYRGPMRTATSEPVYPTNRYRPEFPLQRRPLKHRLGPSFAAPNYVRPRHPHNRGGGYRGRGRGGSHSFYNGDHYSAPPRGRGSYRPGRGRGGYKDANQSSQISKAELDSQLDNYMSQTKSGLDRQIDNYMKND